MEAARMSRLKRDVFYCITDLVEVDVKRNVKTGTSKYVKHF